MPTLRTTLVSLVVLILTLQPVTALAWDGPAGSPPAWRTHWIQTTEPVDVFADAAGDVSFGRAASKMFFRVDAPQVTAEALEGDEEATLIADSSALFSARVDPRTSARVGSDIRLAVDPSRFHFFDPQSGASLLLERRPAAVAVAGR